MILKDAAWKIVEKEIDAMLEKHRAGIDCHHALGSFKALVEERLRDLEKRIQEL